MIRSMTAFARCQHSAAFGTLTWELRSVNHRYLDVYMRLPEDFRALEGKYREHITAALSRGKLECTLRFVPETVVEGGVQIHEDMTRSVIRACQKINDMLHQPSEIDPVRVLAWPGVVQEHQLDYKPILAASEDCLKQALTQLIENREAEGQRLKQLIEHRAAAMRVIVDDVRKVMPEIIQCHREKLRSRLEELKVEVDQDRFEQEMVYLIQKMDVEEELDRLDSHVKELADVLQREEAVGRRLDFLMQELNREANTLGSKSADIRTTQASVELKVLIEQMREQVQNIE